MLIFRSQANTILKNTSQFPFRNLRHKSSKRKNSSKRNEKDNDANVSIKDYVDKQIISAEQRVDWKAEWIASQTNEEIDRLKDRMDAGYDGLRKTLRYAFTTGLTTAVAMISIWVQYTTSLKSKEEDKTPKLKEEAKKQ